ncbi:MAG: diguanylate cyclase [Bacillota bacterium]
MKKISKYELMYINFTWIFILIFAAHIIVEDFIKQTGKGLDLTVILKLSFLLAVTLLNFIKLKTVRKDLFSNKKYYIGFRLLEPVLVSFAVICLGTGEWTYIILTFPVLVTCLYVGIKPAFAFVAYAFVSNLLVKISYDLYCINNRLSGKVLISERYFQIVLLYIVLFLYALMCGKIYRDNCENEQQNKKLFEEIADRYDQLAVAQEEIKTQNEKLKDTNSKIEDANKKLRESLAELFTVQQITQAISSILDIKELLKHVNDIIIGVMGVSSSSIILFDEKRGRLKVHTTNITSRNELISLNDNINCQMLMEALNSGEPILENFVDVNEYPFTEERDVNSLICIPLITKTKKFGLVLIEHKYFNAFDDDNLRLLNIIGQQVGIAMENVELYEKMHELATIDSLTGVYNRLYFQERLKQEFENAEKEKYDLSLAIFDIDHFKQFNDTFGHLFGDKVLKHIAELIKNSLRSGDILARFGGEEFVILLPRTGIKEAFEKVEHLREKLARTSIKDELVTASVTVSFGLSSYPEYVSSEGDLLRTADNALYEAKECGRNCIRIPKGTEISK